ncbi:MAG: EF-hand domain-containing protein [Rhizobium sp.]
MSGISSVGSSGSTTYYSPLDTNQDGIVDATELQAATQAGLVPARTSSDDSSDPSATDKFSDNLVGMLLQIQQASASASTAEAASSGDSPDRFSVASSIASSGSDDDGAVAAAEPVAGRLKDNEAGAKTLETENKGMLNEGQIAQNVDVTSGLASASASADEGATSGSGNALEAFLAEMQASMAAYQHTYGQYDLSDTLTDSAAA